MATVTISIAHEAVDMAAGLIKQHHPHLEQARILFLFTDQERRSRGKVIAAKTSKLSPLDRFLASGMEAVAGGAEFLVLISESQWTAHRGEGWRRALLDHELCHIAEDVDSEGEPRLVLRAHDLEEFADILLRRGLWQDGADADIVRDAVQQLQFSEPAMVGARS